MSNIERNEGGNQNFDPVDIIARYVLGEFGKERLSKNDQFVLDYYSDLRFDDPAFDKEVRERVAELEKEQRETKAGSGDVERKNAMEIAAQIALGRINPADLSDEIRERVKALQKEAEENQELCSKIIYRENEIALRPVNKRKEKHIPPKRNKHNKKDPFYVQPNLWPAEPHEPLITPVEENRSGLEIQIDNMGKMANSRMGWKHDKELRKETAIRKKELRAMINLPVARKGSGHENDGFYKFLTRKVVTWDVFSIFKDYLSLIGDPPEDLKIRIETVRDMINIVTSPESGLNQREKYNYYHDTLSEYLEKWNRE